MNAPADWWKSFFGGLAVDFWQAAIPAQATAADAVFLWKHLLLRPGARVLDVPCGHGRLSVELAQRGCDVTGVDFSADALALARAAAEQRGLSIAWRQGEMRELPGRAEFDAAFCFGNSFGYLDDAGNEAFLAAVARAVVPGGRFAFDYGQSAESIFPRLESHMEAEMGGIRFVEETRYDVASARIENRFTLSRGETTETKLASQRVYMVSEIARLLRQAGFRILQAFASPAEEPFAMGSPNLLIVTERLSAGEPWSERSD